MYVPAIITAKVILRPDYDNRDMHFGRWFKTNEDALAAYYRVLQPDIRGPDFLEFAMCQHDIESVS